MAKPKIDIRELKRMRGEGKTHGECAEFFGVEVKEIEAAENQLMEEWWKKHKREPRFLHEQITNRRIVEEISKPFGEKVGRKPWLEDNDD